MHAADWIYLAGVIVIAATWAVISARRADAAQDESAHHEARAEQAAERAPQAAEDAAASHRCTGEAFEQQNRMAEEQADLAEGVPWRLACQIGSMYDLWNDTDTPKFHVHISGPGVLREKSVDRIDGRSSAEFMGLDAHGAGGQVDVTWHRREDQSDKPRQWTGNKPPKR